MTTRREVDVAWAYRTYFPLLLRKCERMLGPGPDAQDVAQDTFVRLWSARFDLHDTDRVVGWLYTTSTRLGVDRLRTRRPSEGPDALLGPDEHQPDRVVAARRLLDHLARRLDPDALALLVWTRVDGLTQPEVAALTGSSERTVRRRLVELEQTIAGWRDHE